MSQIGNGSNPGGDGDATTTAGKQGNAALEDNDAGLDETDDKGGKGPKPEPKGKLMTDEQINAIVQKRLARHTKDLEEKAKLSETQLLERERDEALAKARRADTRDTWIQSSGLEYAQASRLFKMYERDIEFDDKGRPENLKDVLAEARKEWPELFKKKPAGAGSGDLGAGQGDDKRQGVSMNDSIRRLAGRK